MTIEHAIDIVHGKFAVTMISAVKVRKHMAVAHCACLPRSRFAREGIWYSLESSECANRKSIKNSDVREQDARNVSIVNKRAKCVLFIRRKRRNVEEVCISICAKK